MTIDNGPNRQRPAVSIMHDQPNHADSITPLQPWRQGDCVALALQATQRPELPGRELVDAPRIERESVCPHRTSGTCRCGVTGLDSKVELVK